MAGDHQRPSKFPSAERNNKTSCSPPFSPSPPHFFLTGYRDASTILWPHTTSIKKISTQQTESRHLGTWPHTTLVTGTSPGLLTSRSLVMGGKRNLLLETTADWGFCSLQPESTRSSKCCVPKVTKEYSPLCFWKCVLIYRADVLLKIIKMVPLKYST